MMVYIHADVVKTDRAIDVRSKARSIGELFEIGRSLTFVCESDGEPLCRKDDMRRLADNLIRTITVELARGADGQVGLTRRALIGAELALGAFWRECRGVVVPKRELVFPAASVVADTGRIAERRRVAVRLELVGPELEPLVAEGARCAECVVVGGVCAESPETEA